MEHLPKELWISTLANNKICYKDIAEFGQISNHFNHILKTEDFWERIIHEKYKEKGNIWATLFFTNQKKKINWKTIYQKMEMYDIFIIYMPFFEKLLLIAPLTTGSISNYYNDVNRSDETILTASYGKSINPIKIRKLIDQFHLENMLDFSIKWDFIQFIYQ